MAIIRTTDKRKFEVEVSAKKADEEIVRVGARAISIVDLKVAAKMSSSTSMPATSSRSRTTTSAAKASMRDLR